MKSAILLVSLLVLAGCTGPSDDATVAPAEPVPTSLIKTGPAVGPDLNATTEAAPRLIEGEWWRIRFDSDLLDMGGADMLRIVANASPHGYVFGMPHEAWIKEAISFHAPAFGDVGLDLSYPTHNEFFHPVQFPLVAGNSWDTKFATMPMRATVESADSYVAIIRFDPLAEPSPTDPVTDLLGLTGSDEPMRLTYDARMHEIVRMESAIGSWEVIEHGYDFEGWVSVPKGEHTAIDYGAFGPQPDHPTGTRAVEVDARFNRITVLHVLVALSPGSYRLSSTAPDGSVHVLEHIGGEAALFQIFEVADPGGTWTQEDLHAGVGATYTMGIAYEQYDILVPSGERRPTHGHEVVR
jgi:hypothetical protein